MLILKRKDRLVSAVSNNTNGSASTAILNMQPSSAYISHDNNPLSPIGSKNNQNAAFQPVEPMVNTKAMSSTFTSSFMNLIPIKGTGGGPVAKNKLAPLDVTASSPINNNSISKINSPPDFEPLPPINKGMSQTSEGFNKQNSKTI